MRATKNEKARIYTMSTAGVRGIRHLAKKRTAGSIADAMTTETRTTKITSLMMKRSQAKRMRRMTLTMLLVLMEIAD